MDIPEKLISAKLVAELSLESLQELTLTSGSVKWKEKLKYEISIFEIVYSTRYIDNSIHASGLLYVPKSGSQVLPLLSLQHGTIFLKTEAPSECIGFAGGELISSAGYNVLQPDYIGYGVSKNIFHPYYDKAHAASSSLDMILAALTFLNTSEIHYSKNLFLLGYSEGGYNTLALQALLEIENSTGLALKAVAAGAGGYDLFSMLSDFTTGTGSHVQPSYIVFLLMAYEITYRWNKPLSHYFSTEYAAILPGLMQGDHNNSYINHMLSSNLALLFNPEFYQNLTGSGEMELKKALFINSLSDWKPLTPLKLYHGTEDEVIPFRNSEITYEKLQQKGGKELSFLSIPKGNHATSKAPMTDSALDWFTTFLD